jgi:succinate-acetate transporter protein
MTNRAANPAPLGLVGFGLTTVVLSSINAGLLPKESEIVVVPLALAFGGLIQLVAGVMEFRNGNTFGTVAFTSYGAFWLWFAFLLLFIANGILRAPAVALGMGLGVTLVMWGVFTVYLWIASFRLTRAIWWVFLTLWITFFLLGIGEFGFPTTRLGGWTGLLCGLLAMYTSSGEVVNEVFGHEVIPLGRAAVPHTVERV